MVNIPIRTLLVVVFSVARASAATPSKQMADGKQWTMQNLDVKTDSSYCYQDNQANCAKFGRLYT